MINEIWNGLPVVIFGTGATSRENENIIRRINLCSHMPVFNFLGFVSDEPRTDDAICADDDISVLLERYGTVGAIIPFSYGAIKENIYNRFKHLKGLVWPSMIDPDAVILNKNSVTLGIGNVIEAGATININVQIGSFNLININSTIGHDCKIGSFCAINPGAVLSGGVVIENNVLIGAGAIVKQNLRLGQNSVLGLGAFTVDNIEPEKIMVCDKAKELKRN